MILPMVQLRVTRPQKARTLNLTVAKYILGGYDVLLGQDFMSPSKSRQFWGPNSPNNPTDLSPVPGTASVLVPRPQPDLSSGESRQSTPLPVPLGRTEQCQSPSAPAGETNDKPIPVPVPSTFFGYASHYNAIREDKVPHRATINRCKLITNEGINHFKMMLPTVKLRITRPHRSEICDLAVTRYIPGSYDLLLGQDFQSPSKLQQSRGPNPPNYSLGTSKPQTPAFVPLSVPPECNVQWPPPSRSIPNPIPMTSPAPEPVPGPQIDPPLGDPTLDSQSLPVSLGSTEQCQAPSIPNDEQFPNQLLVPGLTLVPAPEHAPDLHSRDPSPGPLSSPSLAPLPVPLRETEPSGHSGSSPIGAA
ncbi:uncharacterized protein [Macrobrachium rosenbergii]|uniref:uncharacterized protein n=1 Tax=Macrobrachium rosenbergii TaxID=79674 RepID=UPI0034D5AD52